MAMYNPPHPGEFIKEVYLEPLGVSPRSVALRLKVSPSTFSRLVKGQSAISPEMALRLSKCLGRTTVLDMARFEEVVIKRRGGEMFTMLFKTAQKSSPFDVPGVKTKASPDDILIENSISGNPSLHADTEASAANFTLKKEYCEY